jgi:methanethiol S-methyltransferase
VREHILLAILWILYGVLHSLFANRKVKEKAAMLMGKNFRFYRLFYSLFALVTFVLILVYLLSIRSPHFYESTLFTKLLGVTVSLFGLVIMSVCIAKYFVHLSGITSLYKSMPRPAVLQITGIHKYVRHPLYLGTFIFIWGLFILIPNRAMLITDVVITVYTLIGMHFEEQKLISEFGEQYKLYKSRVPKIIPFVKGRGYDSTGKNTGPTDFKPEGFQ